MIKKFTQGLPSGFSPSISRWFLALALPLMLAQTVQAQLNYVAVPCSDPYVQAFGQTGTTFVGQGDDAVFTIALPFPFTFYTTTYNSVNAGTNGFMMFPPGTNRGFTNATLPTATAGAAMLPFWDDLDANQATSPNAGIYTRTDGTAPNRIFTVEWFQIGHFADAANQVITFQVRLFENGNRIQFKYFDTVFGGTQAAFDNGASATIGVEGPLPAPRPSTLVSFNTANAVTAGQCIEFLLPQACNPIPGGPLTVNTTPGTCEGTADVALPAFDPAGCANGTTTGLRYKVNGGVAVPVTLPATSVTISGLPQGNNVITWETFLIANGALTGTANQAVTVVDNEAPVITCPNNITINLAPGACATTYSYTVDCADNCPFLIPGSVNLPFSTANGQAGAMFDVTNLSTLPMVLQSVNANLDPGTWTMEVYYTTTAASFNGNQTNAGAWTLAGTASVTSTNVNNFTIIDILNVPLAPGQSRGIYVTSTTGFPVNYSNVASTVDDGNLRLTAGNGKAYPFGGTFNPRSFSGGINYSIQGMSDPFQLTGLPSGAEFPIGTTVNIWQCNDLAGNPATCSFSVTVNEYPNAIQSLICNDLVQVSVDENCAATIGADQVLEGGPYGCYDNYIVEVDKTAPFGNGPWLPAVFGPSDIGKTYQIRVTDPATGNKCWGNIKIEDKLPPVLDCPPGSVACNADPAPSTGGAPPGPSTQLSTISTGGNLGNPGGLVFFDIDNISGGDIELTSIGLSLTANSMVQIWTKAGTHVGFETNQAAWTQSGMADATTGAFGVGVWTPAPITTGPIVLPPGITGVGLIAPNASHNYTNGNGGNQLFTDGSVTLTLGTALNFPWNAPVFNPRVWNGYIVYNTASAGGPAYPNGLEYNVNVFPTGTAGCYTVTAGAGDPVLEPCSDASLCYIDTEVTQDCASGLTKIINRKWTATDASGNTATCIQVIEVRRPTLGGVSLPPNYDDVDEPSLPCSGLAPNQITPNYLEGIGLQGYPYAFGNPDGCSIGWTYEDAVIGVCDGTYKIRRKWTIIDWCSGDDIEHNQIIKVADHDGPTFDCPANITVSTDPFTCCATVDLPDFIASDNCSRIKAVTAMVTVSDPQTGQVLNMYNVGGSMSSFPGNNLWEPDTMVNVGSTPCLPIGSHLVQYTLEDDCGNTTTCTFRVIVRDFTPPVAACDEFTVVGIGVDDPFDCYGPAGFLDVPPALDACNFAGVTWVKATTFDDGSYDNCGDVRFSIRRMAPYSDCITGLNPIRGFPDCASPFPTFPSEFERAITEGDSIKFYCCEVGTEQTVILTVYQLDANGNIVIGPSGEPVRNECMITVSVQDKIKPVWQSPANVTVSCENFDPSLWAYGKAAV
ncbi:MAG: HYR domain-containing protein [Lewinellaceae bacterium]|nr:HYR domain-containing protein [Lewinellaceae bacterium]